MFIFFRSDSASVKAVCPIPTLAPCHRATFLLAGVGHLFLIALILLGSDAFAAGKDILLGAEEDMLATVKGTLRIIFYSVELVIAAATYIKTRSPMVFVGALALTLFFEAFLKIFLNTSI